MLADEKRKDIDKVRIQGNLLERKIVNCGLSVSCQSIVERLGKQRTTRPSFELLQGRKQLLGRFIKVVLHESVRK